MGARASTPSRAPYSRCGAALLVATLGALAQARGQELSLDLPLDVPVDLRLAPATDDYRTPLAGERYETELFGERVVVERRDRSNTTALTLGGGAFAPSVGGTTSVPIGSVIETRLPALSYATIEVPASGQVVVTSRPRAS